MLREIKFREWHVTQKRMFFAEEMAVDQLTLLPTGNFINVHGGSTRLSEIYERDDFIPLQYTGLKDVSREIIRIRCPDCHTAMLEVTQTSSYLCPKCNLNLTKINGKWLWIFYGQQVNYPIPFELDHPGVELSKMEVTL